MVASPRIEHKVGYNGYCLAHDAWQCSVCRKFVDGRRRQSAIRDMEADVIEADEQMRDDAAETMHEETQP